MKTFILSIFIFQFFTTQSRFSPTLTGNASGYIVEKDENAGNQHFLLFHKFFLLTASIKTSFDLLLICCLQMLSFWWHQRFPCLVQSLVVINPFPNDKF